MTLNVATKSSRNGVILSLVVPCNSCYDRDHACIENKSGLSAPSMPAAPYKHPLNVLNLIGLVVVLALPLALQKKETPKPPGGAGQQVTLVIISPHSSSVRAEFARAFSEWTERQRGHTTAIEWLNVGGTADGIRYVQSEFTSKPAGIGVDLFFGGGMDPYVQFKASNLLQPFQPDPEILNAIPASIGGVPLYDADACWYGTCLGAFGILFNIPVLERLNLPEPRQWSDLANPAIASWVGSGDPRISGSSHMVYETILQAYGWDEGWATLTAMSANTRTFSRSAGEVPKDVSMGEVACGSAVDVYAWRQMEQSGDRLDFVLPDRATVITPDSVGILKGAPNAELAGCFINFLLSPAGQNIWCLRAGTPGGPLEHTLNRMPIRPGIVQTAGSNAAVKLDPFAITNRFISYNPTLGSARWGILNDLVGAWMIDTQSELKAAWLAVNSPDTTGATPINRLVEPPMSQADALALAAGEWKEPATRSQLRLEWAEAARQRYRKVQ